MNKVKAYMDRLVDWTCVVLLSVATVVCFYQVVARYVFSAPPTWSEEVARYAFIWLTFLGSALAFRAGAHLGMDAVTSALPRQARRVVALLSSAILLTLLGFMMWQGRLVVSFVTRQLSPAMRLSMSIPYAAIPVGAFFMFVEVLWNAARVLRE